MLRIRVPRTTRLISRHTKNSIRAQSTRPGPSLRNPRQIYSDDNTHATTSSTSSLSSPPPSSSSSGMSDFRIALRKESLVDIQKEWKQLRGTSNLQPQNSGIPSSDIDSLAEFLRKHVPSLLAPKHSTEAVRDATAVTLRDAEEMSVFVASKGKLAPIVQCMQHALEAGQYARVLELWNRIERAAPAAPSGQRTPQSPMSSDEMDASEIVYVAYAMLGDYRSAIQTARNPSFTTPICRPPPQSIHHRSTPIPRTIPIETTDAFIRNVRLIVGILTNGATKETLTQYFTSTRSAMVTWHLYQTLLQGCQGETPWVSLAPLDHEKLGAMDTPTPGPIFHWAEPTWAMLASEFVRLRRIDLAERLVEDRGRIGLPPSSFLYNILLDAHGKKGDLAATKKIWAQISQRPDDGRPDVYSYTTMISTLFQAYEIQDAMALFNEAQNRFAKERTPGAGLPVTTYNAAVHGLLINGLATEAEALCEKMRTAERGIPRPNSITYNTFLRHYQRKRDGAGFLRILRLFGEDSKSGVTPDVYTYTTIIDTLLQSNQSGAVPRLLDIMETMGVPPNTATYTTIVDSLIRRKGLKNIRMALDLVDKMERDGVATNEVTYTSLLAGVTRDESLGPDVSRGLIESILKRMTDRGIEPNRVTSDFLIEAALSRRDGVEEAMGYFRRASSRHIPIQTYFVILTGLAKRKQYNYAQEVLEHLRASGLQTRGALDNLVRKVQREIALGG